MSNREENDQIRDVFLQAKEEAARRRVHLPALSPSAYEHPLDRTALTAAKRVPMLPQVIKAVVGFLPEQQHRLLYFASSIRVGPDQFPEIHARFVACCDVLDMPYVPELYITQTPDVNAMAVGADRPFIVLNSSTLSLLKGDELDFVLGHELGHILSGHVLYKTVLNLLSVLSTTVLSRFGIPIAGIALQAVLLALQEWDRKAELSGDRAGLLCIQSPEAAYWALMKLAGGGAVEQMDIDAFLRQADEYHEDDGARDQLLKLMNLMGRSHPFPTRRAKELKKWIESGAYERILSGEYTRRGEESAASTTEPTDTSSTDTTPSSAWSEILASVNETGKSLRRQFDGLVDSARGDTADDPNSGDDADEA